MTRHVVVDASAGVEILTGSERGRFLTSLLPPKSALWVPEHFYAEVLGVIRHLQIVAGRISETRAHDAIDRLSRWHLRRVGLTSLLVPAWALRFNMSGADALYVALAQTIDGALLTDDTRLAHSPNMPSDIEILHIGRR